jgi:hypothetical protein
MFAENFLALKSIIWLVLLFPKNLTEIKFKNNFMDFLRNEISNL